jgi:hypothetical protein
MSEATKLSTKARAILQFIAEGHSYQQILDAYSGFTYMDIFKAAQEVLDIVDNPEKHDNKPAYDLGEIRISHPRAYEKWSADEDAKLSVLFNSGADKKSIAEALKRQGGAIQSRLRKLGFIE